ncbi:LysR family transcriptional regulator [Lichenicoccus sp.]|uniref:LysR family transcriptional regulator n=1 Tax=Lichenicoccus sp. TaxID=2781899 RepID=UPI003D0D8FDA
MDRLDLVRLFLRVAETSQVSQAARDLGISQPTASRLLRKLEDLFGRKLVDRASQGLTLTQEGRDLLPHARKLAEAWNEANDAVRGDEALSGTIRVAVPIATGGTFLAVIAARFQRAHPDVAIEWHLRDDRVDVIAQGYDLWIRVGDVHREDLVVRDVYRIQRAIVAAAGWPGISHPSDLLPMAAVRLSTFVPGTVELTNNGEIYQLRQRAMFTTDNLQAACSAVLEGVGYAVLPLWCLHEHLERGALASLCDDWRPPTVTLSFAYAPNRKRSPRVAALIAHIHNELQDDNGLGISFLRDADALESVTRINPST